jgi:hypothetical protein
MMGRQLLPQEGEQVLPVQLPTQVMAQGEP